MRMKKVVFLVFLFPFLLGALTREDVLKLAREGKVREAIDAYRNYFQERKKHDAGLVEEIFLAFLRNRDAKYGFATRRDAGEIVLREVKEGKRNREELVGILKENLRFPEPGVKVTAAKLLLSLEYWDPSLLPALREGLYKGNVAVSLEAASLLPRLGEKGISLLQEALGSNNPFVAVMAVKGIAEVGGEKGKRLLLKGLNYRVSQTGAGRESLRGIPFSGLMGTFYTPLQVQIASAKELGKFSGEDVVKALAKGLRSSEKNLRLACLFSLGEIAKREGKTPQRRWFRRKGALYYIKKATQDEELKDSAYQILASLGDQEAINYFQAKLKEEDSFEALRILSQLKKKEALDYITSRFSSVTEKEKKRYIRLLTPFGEDALPLLEKASRDTSTEVKKEVVRVLARLRKGREILERLARDENPFVRREAVFALTGLHLTGEWALDALLEMGFFGLKIPRKELAKALAPTDKREEIISTIKRWIGTVDEYTRIELAEILLGLGEKEVSLSILKKSLGKAQGTRYARKALYALAEVGDPQTFPYLEKRFFDYGYMEVLTVRNFLTLLKKYPSSPREKLPTRESGGKRRVKEETKVYVGNRIIATLGEGEEVRALQEKGKWVLVEFLKGGKILKGWIDRNSLQ